LLNHFPEFGGCLSGFFFEGCIERRLRIESRLVHGLENGQFIIFGFFQDLLNFLNSVGINKIEKAFVKRLIDYLRQVLGRYG
jgi:hypothetical protein